MSKPGPNRTPAAILEARGSWRAGRRTAEPAFAHARPLCPASLTPAAKRVWKRVLPQIPASILARADRQVLVRYCSLYVQWRAAQDHIDRHGLTYPVGVERDETGKIISVRAFKEHPQVRLAIKLSEHLLRIEREFGLSPGARANLTRDLPSAPEENRGKSRFFNAKSGAGA